MTLEDREERIHHVFQALADAEKKHPCWPVDPFEMMAILGEEYGSLQKAFLDYNYGRGGFDPCYQEALHVAAMALRFLFSLDISCPRVGTCKICGAPLYRISETEIRCAASANSHRRPD